MKPQALPLHKQQVRIIVVSDCLQRLLGSNREGVSWKMRTAAMQMMQHLMGPETDAESMDADLG